MTRKRSIAAMVCALVMALSLCGCGKTTVEEYDSATEYTVEALGLDELYASHDPEETVFTVEGAAVTWQELFYQIAYYAEYVALQEGKAITDWNDECSLFTDENGEYYTYGTVVLQNAVTMLVQYHTVYEKLTAAGAVLGKEALDSVETTYQNVLDTNFDGDEDAFLEYLDGLYCTKDMWMWYNQVDALYNYDGFETLYGEMGSDLSDEDVMTYAAGDPDGSWTEYVQIKQIYLNYDANETTEDETESDDEDTTETDTSDDETVQTIQAALDAAEDKEAAFDELYAQYNENDALDVYPDGWCIYEGDTDDAIYEAALEMEDYEYSVVSIDEADVVVMKIPIDPDATVVYDSSDGTTYTLRYFAAWQAYITQVSGTDGWIANAQTEWAEGFEDFSLTSSD